MERVSIKLEFLFKASPAMLYGFVTTPSSLVRWFCDDVEIEEGVYTFFWEGADEQATLIEDIEDERVRFEFSDYEDGEFLEYSFRKSPVTNETILEIVDFCDADETDDQRILWESQMERLRSQVGG